MWRKIVPDDVNNVDLTNRIAQNTFEKFALRNVCEKEWNNRDTSLYLIQG